jgi:hypothetical protein
MIATPCISASNHNILIKINDLIFKCQKYGKKNITIEGHICILWDIYHDGSL